MDNSLYTDINSQPDNLQQVIEHLYGPERRALEEAAGTLHPQKPIVFVGMGSAAYLNMPAEYYLNGQGRYASTVYGTDAFYSMLPVLKDANVVINSRSGETVEIVQVSRALAEANITFTAITNEPESTLAQLADHVIWVNTRKDTLVSINIVTSMMLATLAFAAFAVGQSGALHEQMVTLPGLMEKLLAASWERADELAEFFSPIRPIYLLHRGPAKGAAYCGRLVLEEVARTPAVTLDAGEFRQGPIEVVDQAFGTVIFVQEGKQGELNRALGEDIVASGGRVLFISDRERKVGESTLSLSYGTPIGPLSPVLEVIPTQVLAYKLAEGQGVEPGQVRYISKVITNEVGIPNQSGR